MSNDKETKAINLVVNNNPCQVNPKHHSSLQAYLRNELRLTGTKLGCAMGDCGACTVLIDNTAMQSCQIKLTAVAYSDVQTVEEIVQTPLGNQIANALSRNDAAQCGYCLPGIVVAAFAECLHAKNPSAIKALQRNLCRCGTHSRILSALQEVFSDRDASS